MPVDDVKVEAALGHFPEVVADMVRLERLTGMRPVEVCMLRPCDLDRSKEAWIYRPESHKTEHYSRERIIPIGPRAQKVLLRYLVRDSQECCFRPCDSEAKRRAEARKHRKTPLSCIGLPSIVPCNAKAPKLAFHVHRNGGRHPAECLRPNP